MNGKAACRVMRDVTTSVFRVGVTPGAITRALAVAK